MSASAGDRLGPYELVSRIGAGGMGEVWRARDTRLDRSVAVKILPSELSGNAQLRIRFEREARTISRLDHPHICALYDVGENYLVMELLEGESLADRLLRGPLPLADVTRYGAQIAHALDRAHRAGVVHRDLKPGNVVLTRAGAKLLDFGLAKSVAIDARADDATQHKPLTAEGSIVGTFQYMAPEQLDGLEADSRTDIFALGAVLYEMITGRRAFEGKTRSSLIAAIVAGNPRPVSELQPLTPPALEHLIAKCLCKDPDDRWQSAHDVGEELRWIESAGSQAGVAAVPVRRKKSWERLAWLAALLTVLAVAAWLALRPRDEPAVIEAAITTEENGGVEYRSGPPALSPDGKSVVYAARTPRGRTMLWLRALDRGPARAIEGTEGAFSPFWSPDGRFIGFNAGDGSVRKVAAGGGQVDTLVRRTFGGWSWNRDNVILYVNLQPEASVSSVPASGGATSALVRGPDLGATLLAWPTFLPDGNHFLFLAKGAKLEQSGREGLWVGTLDRSEPPRFLMKADANALFVEPGQLLFVRDGTLRTVAFDLGKLRPAGEEVAITPLQVYDFLAMFAASDNGVLLYQPVGGAPMSELTLMNRKGEKLRRFGTPAYYWSPALSPDGKRIAVDRSDSAASGDIWLVDAEGAARFSFDPRNETAPVWSPDGQELLYSMDIRPGVVGAWRKRIGEAPRPLFEKGVATDWSPDGRHLVVDNLSDAQIDVRVWALAEEKWTAIADTRADESRASFSPDGKWIVYQSDETGRFEVYVQPFPPTGTKYQVSTEGGCTARWLRSGEITWVDADDVLQIAKVETVPAFRAAAPSPLFPVDQRDRSSYEYDAAPDGTFLVNVSLPAPRKPLTLVVNWPLKFSAQK